MHNVVVMSAVKQTITWISSVTFQGRYYEARSYRQLYQCILYVFLQFVHFYRQSRYIPIKSSHKELCTDTDDSAFSVRAFSPFTLIGKEDISIKCSHKEL